MYFLIPLPYYSPILVKNNNIFSGPPCTVCTYLVVSVMLLFMRIVHLAPVPEAHDEVLNEPRVRLPAHGLGLGAGEVLEAHGELAVALAQLMRARIPPRAAALAGDWKNRGKRR